MSERNAHTPPRRVAVITGVSRRRGIAAAIARRLAPSHDLLLTGFADYDAAQEWGSDAGDVPQLLDELQALGARVRYVAADFLQETAPAAVVDAAIDGYGRVDSLVATHTYSTETMLGALDAAEIDRHLIINVRGTLLLVEAFARAHHGNDGQGRIVLFSSGQRLAPMPSELAYAASKGGLEALVMSLADALNQVNITVNAVNPGPTDTGWLSGEAYDFVRQLFPSGRWGEPDDAARAVEWLTSDAASWISGQIIDSEGGFRRWAGPALPPTWAEPVAQASEAGE